MTHVPVWLLLSQYDLDKLLDLGFRGLLTNRCAGTALFQVLGAGEEIEWTLFCKFEEEIVFLIYCMHR